MAGKVIRIESKEDWEEQLKAATDEGKTVIVDFSAEWCGPCRVIAPHYEALAEAYPQMVFLSVDVDKVEDVASEQGVGAMPTFQIYVKGKKEAELIGANKEKLAVLCKTHCTS